MSTPRETVRRYARFQATMRRWVNPGLRLERLEDRLAPAVVRALSETDPRFWGDTGNTGSGVDSVPFVTADGQRVIFESDANNLVPNDFNAVRDVFILDRSSGKITAIGSNATKTGTSQRGGFDFDATPDGRYVAFRSDSNDFPGSPPINNGFLGQQRVWWYDTLTADIKLVTADPAGNDTGAGFDVQISDDGKFVSFLSGNGTLLTPQNGTTGTTHAFIRDIANSTTALASVNTSGKFANFASNRPRISGDGKWVAFETIADDLDVRDSNTAPDIFFYDVANKTTKLATVFDDGSKAAGGQSQILQNDVLSFDGRFLVYSGSPSGVQGGTTIFQSVYLFDRVAQRTFLVGADKNGKPGGGFHPTITSNGRFVTFTDPFNVIQSDVMPDNANAPDVYLADVTDPLNITRRLVSVNAAGDNGGNSNSGPSPFTFTKATEDGRYVAYHSFATDLVAGFKEGNNLNSFDIGADVFVRDLQLNKTFAVSVVPGSSTDGGKGRSTIPVLSADGKTVLFVSDADNLLTGGRDGNVASDVFVRDLTTGLTEAVSLRTPLLPAEQVVPVSDSRAFDTTPDGRFTVFQAAATRLVPDLPGVSAQLRLFVADRKLGTTTLVTFLPDGTIPPPLVESDHINASISDDGRFVSFVTGLDSLDKSVTARGVYVRDLVAGETKLISRNPTGGAAGNQFFSRYEVEISPDGRFVAFGNTSTNLLDGVATTGMDLYLFDRTDGKLRSLTANAAGTASGNKSASEDFTFDPVFSADSSRLVFVTRSTDLLAGVTDTNNERDIYAVDLTGPTPFTRRLVSGVGNTTGVGFAIEPSISGDGKLVSFTGQATFDGALSNLRNVFVRDVAADTITWASKPTAAGNNTFHTNGESQLTDDGKTLFFSSAANLDGNNPLQNFNPVVQIYSRDLATGTLTLQSAAAGTTTAAIGASNSPFISPNGRYLAFASDADTLTTGFVDGNGNGLNLFVRDLQTGQTTLVDASATGLVSGDAAVGRFAVSDTGTVILESSSGNLLPQTRKEGLFAGVGNFFYAFDFKGAASIAGKLVNDLNANGKADANEPGIGFATAYIDANGNERFDRGELNATADMNGNYRLTNLAAGTYTVRAQLETGFGFTSPLTGGQSVTVATGTTDVTDTNFFALIIPADLAVTSVTGPVSASPGNMVPVSFVVRNVGGGTVNVATADSVYLSADDVLDVTDTLLAIVPHSGKLKSGETYTGNANVTLPAVLPGNYRFIVSADRRFAVTTDDNRANNVAASVPTVLTVPDLFTGTPTTGAFSTVGELRYYKITVAPGQTLQLALDSAAASGALELFASRNELPTTGDADFAAVTPQPDQTLSVPFTEPGTYYVLARARGGAAATAGFTLTTTLAGFAVTGIDRPTAGAGVVTLGVRGTRFTDATQVALVSGGTTINATSVTFVDGGSVFATFDLTNVAPGTFDVRATDGANTATLAAAFTVGGPTMAINAYDIRLISPGFLRQGRLSSIVVEYTNTTDVNQPAPLLEIRANTPIRLAEQTDFIGDFGVESGIDFLAVAPDGPAGTLRPGQTGRQRVFFRTQGGEGGFTINFQVNILDPGGTATIDWNQFKDGLRPTTTSVEAFDAVFANFLAEVGTTTGDYVRLLGANASYLSGIGTRSGDVARLFAFELEQANGGYGFRTPVGTVDAAVAGAGGGITFSRAFGTTIADRYRVGPFGRGWSHNWEVSLTQDVAGNVTITEGSLAEVLVRQPDGSFRGDGNDPNVLTAVPGGFRLRGPDGRIVRFLADGRLDFTEDRTGNRTTAGYDTSGRLSSLTHSGGTAITLAYNPQGRIERVTESTGRQVTFTYDAAGDHLTGSASVGGAFSYAYVAGAGIAREHALAEVVRPDGIRTQFDYDDRGRPVEQRLVAVGGAATERATLSYDSAAGVTVAPAGGEVGPTTVLFAETGQPARIRDSLGRTTRFGFDDLGRSATTTTAAGLTYSAEYNSLGQPIAITDAAGRTTRYEYAGAFGRVSRLTDARGSTRTFEYDTEGNLTAAVDATGVRQEYTFDANGNLTGTTNRRGRAVGYQHDATGRLTKATYADGVTTFAYDARGNLTTVTDPSGSTVLSYDPTTDRLTKATQPDGRFVAYTYDAVGRRATAADQDGVATKYTYNAYGRLDQLTDAAGTPLVTYQYDSLGRVRRKDNGNGTATAYVYDTAGQLLTLTHLAPGGGVNSQFDYTYDAEGRRASETLTDANPTTADGKTTYTYDPTGQLVGIDLPGGRTIGYEFDAAGNRTRVTDSALGTTTYEADARNQVTKAGATTFTYDADGNLTAADDGVTTTTYTFNDRNQLVATTGPAGTFAYEYDPFGNRRAETRNGVRTEFLIDPTLTTGVAAEYGPGGSLTARYVGGAGLVARVAADGKAAYYDFDASANTVGLTAADGTYASRYTYLPFGETTTVAGGLPNPFTFGGQAGVRQGGDGLALMHFRTYNPATGQFASDDPLGLGGGDPNVRRYVGNSPTNFIDPLGLCSITVGVQGGALLGAGNTLTMNSDGSLFVNISVGLTTTGATLASFSTGDASEGVSASGSIAGTLGNLPPSSPATDPPGASGGLSTNFTDLVGRVFVDENGGFTLNNVFDTGKFSDAVNRSTSANLNAGYDPDGVSVYATYTQQVRGPDPSRAFPCPPNVLNPGNGLRDIGPRLPGPGGGPTIVGAQDPNDITGPAGFGPARFVRTADRIDYTIQFENKAEATAPAQEVFVTTFLDADLDPLTFAFDDLGFGDRIIDVPDGRQAYSTTVPDGNLVVDIAATFDPTTRRIDWVFRSRDPLTGELPEDALAGFLPPNKVAGEGQGFLGYSARPRVGLGDGTEITAQADIVFDTNPVIPTNIYSNKLDGTAPTATVTALPTTTTTTAFAVSWAGNDGAGSGVATYDVFVSKNGGAFTLLLDNTAATSTTFTGADGSRYGFFVVATDGVGFVQATPASEQAFTTVAVPNTAPTISDVADLTTTGPTAPLTFTVGDAQTAVDALTVTIASSNTGLVPVANVVLGGSGANRTVTVTPVVGQSGTATITLTVTDAGGLTATDTFVVTVPPVTPPNTAPTISDVADVTTTGMTAALPFMVSDSQTTADALTVTATSSNLALVPLASIILGGGGANRTVQVVPVAGQSGTATITLTVTDAGGLTATDTFTVTVPATPPNTAPTISDVANVTITGATAPLAFTVGDAQTAADALTVTVASSNTGLVPVANIALGGSGANRTVTITPVAGQSGTAMITLTVTDAGGLTATDTFTVTVPATPTNRPVGLVGVPQFAVGTDRGGSPTVRFFNPDRTERFSVPVFDASFTGGVRTAAADFNGDGVADLVVGTGPGSATRVRVLDGKTQTELFAVDPFEASFTGGVYVAAGDISGDGVPDLIITPDEGGGPRVDAYSGKGFGKFASFFGIDDPNFRGGARASIGDMDGDGVGDLIVVAGFGGGPRVAGFDGKSIGGTPRRLFGDFFAFEQSLRNGIFVAAGDIDGDGFADLVAGGGPGGGPRVTVFSGKDLLTNVQTVRANFFGGDDASRGGIRLAVKDLDGDARARLVVGAGTGAGSRATAYLGKTIPAAGPPPAAFDFAAFDGFTGGVFVG